MELPRTKELKQQVIEEQVSDSLRRIASHPFVRRGQSQELQKEQVFRWIMCAGRESRTFPAILENVMAWIRSETIKQIISSNLDDEKGNGRTEDAHFNHFLILLDELGLSRDSFWSYTEKAGIQAALALGLNVSLCGNPAIAIGYLLINEAITPLAYEAARRSLVRYYSSLGTRFFDLHIVSDKEHVKHLYLAVNEMGEHLQDDICFGITLGERGMTILLDEALGVYDFSPIGSALDMTAK